MHSTARPSTSPFSEEKLFPRRAASPIAAHRLRLRLRLTPFNPLHRQICSRLSVTAVDGVQNGSKLRKTQEKSEQEDPANHEIQD
jgi:hypothetical protein